MITALELTLKVDELIKERAKVDGMITELKEMAMKVELAKGQYDDKINELVRDITGTENGEVHLTEIIQKILSVK